MKRGVWMIGVLSVGLTLQAEESALPALKTEALCVPVVSSRANERGLAPNNRGGWSFIGQFMNYKPTYELEKETRSLPGGAHYLAYTDTKIRPEAEWLIVDLTNGTQKIAPWPGFHAVQVGSVLAGNGRLFFSVDYGHIYYYEPAEDTVKPLGRVCDDRDALRTFYRFILGPDGFIYGSAQASRGLTQLIRLNPDTLEYKLYPNVGLKGRREGLTYGYYLAVDPPWMYVAVGQGNWELFAVNADTGETKCLADLQGDGTRITVSRAGDSCVADLSRPKTPKQVLRLIDGAAIPVANAAEKPEALAKHHPVYKPFEWKKTKPVDLSGKPSLNEGKLIAVDTQGKGEIHWRPAGSTGEWNRTPFAISNAEPVKIESLITLADGSLLGNAEAYNGFFRYAPASTKLDYFGKFGPSRPFSVMLDGLVYFSGYPNTTLYVYDPDKPWTATGDSQGKRTNDNPRQLGTMGQGCTEAHFCRRLLAGMGRLYLMGQRERWSTGTGLGYYEPSTKKFFGLGLAHKTVHPEGLAVLPDPGRVVFSGRPEKGGDARLYVYDRDLNEVDRIEIRPGLASGGDLFASESPSQFYGCVTGPESNRVTFYKYDLKEKKILKQVDVPAEVDAVFTRPADQTWWALSGGQLQQMEPATLALKPVGRFAEGFRNPIWVGTDLLGSRGGELLRMDVH